MPPLVFLAGYKLPKGARDPDDLLRIAEELDAVIVDIRWHPNSRWGSRWDQCQIAGQFGNRYRLVREWGNPNHNKGLPIEIADFVTGWRIVRRIERSVILLCGCYDAENCH